MASYGVLSTYPPTQCGLASFSHALAEALSSETDDVSVVSIVDVHGAPAHPRVTHEWLRDEADGWAGAANVLNSYDVAIIQHEYGIFGGRDGADVLLVARALRVPTVVVLHTVLVTPTPHQRAIVDELAGRCAAVVVMTETARRRLVELYGVDPSIVRVIPHGAADNRLGPSEARPSGARPSILTWGLLGEGKGIEWAIAAMQRLRDLTPAPVYRVVGETHPRVLERHGELYREGLVRLAHRLGVAASVEFDARYLGIAELQRVVHQADVVLLPYDAREQVTSGVLIEAVTAGKPVVSTGFPHARELLSGGAGLLVRREDPRDIAAALRRVLTEPGLAGRMSAEAKRIAPSLLWPTVAAQYRKVADEVREASAVLASA